MSCIPIKNGFMCLANIYKYKDIQFELPKYYGVIKLNKDLSESKNYGKKFWDRFNEFEKLPKKQQEKYSIFS